MFTPTTTKNLIYLTTRTCTDLDENTRSIFRKITSEGPFGLWSQNYGVYTYKSDKRCRPFDVNVSYNIITKYTSRTDYANFSEDMKNFSDTSNPVVFTCTDRYKAFIAGRMLPDNIKIYWISGWISSYSTSFNAVIPSEEYGDFAASKKKVLIKTNLKMYDTSSKSIHVTIGTNYSMEGIDALLTNFIAKYPLYASDLDGLGVDEAMKKGTGNKGTDNKGTEKKYVGICDIDIYLGSIFDVTDYDNNYAAHETVKYLTNIIDDIDGVDTMYIHLNTYTDIGLTYLLGRDFRSKKISKIVYVDSIDDEIYSHSLPQ